MNLLEIVIFPTPILISECSIMGPKYLNWPKVKWLDAALTSLKELRKLILLKPKMHFKEYLLSQSEAHLNDASKLSNSHLFFYFMNGIELTVT